MKEKDINIQILEIEDNKASRNLKIASDIAKASKIKDPIKRFITEAFALTNYSDKNIISTSERRSRLTNWGASGDA